MKKTHKIIAWSMTALSTGKWPDCDEDNRPYSETYKPELFKLAGTDLAGGYRGVWAGSKGDWQWIVLAS
jgi:hypothetical protein